MTLNYGEKDKRDRKAGGSNDAALKKLASSDESKPNSELSRFPNWVLLTIAVALVASFWFATAKSEGPRFLAAAQRPVILADEVEHLSPLAWKAIPLKLTYGGTVSFDIQVIRGDSIDLFLTTSDQLDNLKGTDWHNLKKFGDISAVNTKAFKNAGHFASGGYYLIVSDMAIGVPSSPPSDISVKVQLKSVIAWIFAKSATGLDLARRIPFYYRLPSECHALTYFWSHLEVDDIKARLDNLARGTM